MFLENLNSLMNEYGLNKNTLSKKSGIPYTTIVGFYKKGYENTKLSTLMSLSNFFDVSLDFLVFGKKRCSYSNIDNLDLDKTLYNLIENYKRLDKHGREMVNTTVNLELKRLNK